MAGESLIIPGQTDQERVQQQIIREEHAKTLQEISKNANSFNLEYFKIGDNKYEYQKKAIKKEMDLYRESANERLRLDKDELNRQLGDIKKLEDAKLKSIEKQRVSDQIEALKTAAKPIMPLLAPFIAAFSVASLAMMTAQAKAAEGFASSISAPFAKSKEEMLKFGADFYQSTLGVLNSAGISGSVKMSDYLKEMSKPLSELSFVLNEKLISGMDEFAVHAYEMKTVWGVSMEDMMSIGKVMSSTMGLTLGQVDVKMQQMYADAKSLHMPIPEYISLVAKMTSAYHLEGVTFDTVREAATKFFNVKGLTPEEVSKMASNWISATSSMGVGELVGKAQMSGVSLEGVLGSVKSGKSQELAARSEIAYYRQFGDLNAKGNEGLALSLYEKLGKMLGGGATEGYKAYEALISGKGMGGLEKASASDMLGKTNELMKVQTDVLTRALNILTNNTSGILTAVTTPHPAIFSGGASVARQG